jgi:hypothetical protein
VKKLKESWKGVKKLSKFHHVFSENVWKTNDIFCCKLCWKNWISQPVWASSIYMWHFPWVQGEKWLVCYKISTVNFSRKPTIQCCLQKMTD